MATRSKKAIPIAETYTVTNYSVECPHCHTVLKYGNINKGNLRIECWTCNKPITLDWGNVNGR